MKEQRTLCTRCAGDYRMAGFHISKDGFQVIKGSCDLCGRPGYDYVIKKAEIFEKRSGIDAEN